MKFALFALIAVTSVDLAQAQDGPLPVSEPQAERDDYDAEAWLQISFADRVRLFERDTRDSEWAPEMERAIEAKVAELDRPLVEVAGADICRRLPICQEEMPPVQLASVECRTMLCRLELHWPPGTFRGIVGQQASFLYGLGIDHQGELRVDDDGNRYRVEMIARRWAVK